MNEVLLFLQVSDKAAEKLPAVIETAAKSPLGILALIVIALSLLGYSYFRKAREKTRQIMFALMLSAAVAFAIAVMRTMSFRNEPTREIPVTEQARPNAPRPEPEDRPAEIKQETKGDISPAVAGVKGNVTITNNSGSTRKTPNK